MYNRHKMGSWILVAAVSTFAFVFQWDYGDIAETAITVVSISMAVYIAAASALLGSRYSKDLFSKTDSEDTSRTLLGVLAEYLRLAGKLSLLTIILSCISLLSNTADFPSILYYIYSAISCGIFSVNILFLWLILLFLVNSLTKATK